MHDQLKMNNNYPKEINMHWAKFKCPICKTIVKPKISPDDNSRSMKLYALLGSHDGADHSYYEDIIWTGSLGVEVIEKFLSFEHGNYQYNISEEPVAGSNKSYVSFSRTNADSESALPFLRDLYDVKEFNFKKFSRKKAINKIDLMLVFA